MANGNGNGVWQRVVVGVLTAAILAVGAWVFNVNADVHEIQSNRFTDRDGLAMEQRLRQERAAELSEIKADIRRILDILESRR